MIEAERGIKCGSAVPCSLSVKKYRSVWPNQDVLGANVAVNQSLAMGLCGRDQVLEGRKPVGVYSSGCLEVRFESNRIEDIGGIN